MKSEFGKRRKWICGIDGNCWQDWRKTKRLEGTQFTLLSRNDDDIDSIHTFQKSHSTLRYIALVTSIISYLSLLLNDVLHHPWESEYYSVILSRHLHTHLYTTLTSYSEWRRDRGICTCNSGRLVLTSYQRVSDKDGFYEWRLPCERYGRRDLRRRESSVFGNNCSKDVYTVSSDLRERNHKTNS